jgi:hypothetical protein
MAELPRLATPSLDPQQGSAIENYVRAVAGAASGGVADGDYGDITVSGSGAAWAIDAKAVTLAKMADMATASVIYRKTAGVGAPEVQTLATLKTDLGLTGTNSGDQTITLSGDVSGTGTGAITTTIGANKVTLAMLALINSQRFLGRVSVVTGNVESMTGTQATTILDAMVGDSGAGGTKGLAPAPSPGSAAAGKYLKADGTWSVPPTGADPWTRTVLTSDFNNALTGFGNITDGTRTFTYTPPNNSNFTLEADLILWTTSSTNLPRVGVNVAAGAAAGYGSIIIQQQGATATTVVQAGGGFSNPGAAVNVQQAAGGLPANSTPYWCWISIKGKSGASATQISIQMAAESAAAATCYVKAGSEMRTRDGY